MGKKSKDDRSEDSEKFPLRLGEFNRQVTFQKEGTWVTTAGFTLHVNGRSYQLQASQREKDKVPFVGKVQLIPAQDYMASGKNVDPNETPIQKTRRTAGDRKGLQEKVIRLMEGHGINLFELPGGKVIEGDQDYHGTIEDLSL